MLLIDWTNVRHVPVLHGRFGFDDNIGTILRMMRFQGPGLAVVGVCQGGVPALAATALLAAVSDPATPASLTLIGAPIDPLARPTRVVRLLRERPLAWFAESAAAPVPEVYAGGGRLVYPARLQLMALPVLSRTAPLHQPPSAWSAPAPPRGRFPWPHSRNPVNPSLTRSLRTGRQVATIYWREDGVCHVTLRLVAHLN